jgi:Holliday junction resolvase-like predicted endonuclease
VTGDEVATRRVFISYANDDSSIAMRIAKALSDAGIRVVNRTWEVSAGTDLVNLLHDSIRTSDVVVALISPASIRSRWVNEELRLAFSKDLDMRGAELIPVLVEPVETLPELPHDRVIDITADLPAGVRQIVADVSTVQKADFSKLDPRTFEGFVADLLSSVGFTSVERNVPAEGRGGEIDIHGIYERIDPFGRPETEHWIVEVKQYRHGRVSVNAIQQLAEHLLSAPSGSRGLLVTSTRLTSVAKEFINELEQNRQLRIQVIDGSDLTRLLRQHPAIADRYFGKGPEAVGADA